MDAMRKMVGAVVAGLVATAVVPLSAGQAQAATPTIGQKALNVASAQKGDPYRWGATGPNAFDCSGLIHYSFKSAGKKWSYRMTAQGQYNAAPIKVHRSKRQPGDIIVFGGRGKVYHIGMYAGNGKILHAPGTGKKVRVEKLWTSKVSYARFR